jgi:hypothetical protein
MASNDGPLGNAPNISVGVSDAVLLFVSSIGFIMLAGTIYSIILTRLKSAKQIEEMEQDLDYNQQLANADVSTLNRAQRRARARHIMKQQRRIAPAPTAGAPGNPAAPGAMEDDDNDNDNDNRNNNALLAIRGVQDDDREDDDNEEDDDDGQDQSLHRHLSRKERQKAAKAAEKEERRLFEADRQKQQRAAQETAQREKKLREQRQAEHVEDQRRLRLEQKKEQEQKEFEKWKLFLASVDGTTRTVLVADWISHLEKARGVKNRTVQLDSLAKEYGLPLTTVQQRIQELVDVGRVTGIFEADRQIFIYITQGELRDMAKIIQGEDQVTLQYISMVATELMDQFQPL